MARRVSFRWFGQLPKELRTTAAVSVASHLGVAFAFVALIRFADFGGEVDRPPPQDEVEIELDLQPSAEATAAATGEPSDGVLDRTKAVHPPDVTARGGRDPRPDSGAHGRGGDTHVDAPALNLADRDDSASLERSVLSSLDLSQLSRLRSILAKVRRTREDWRASREPAELTFFAVGKGDKTVERKEKAAFDPGRGAEAAPVRNSRGMELGMSVVAVDDGAQPKQRAGSNVVGGANASPGTGVRTSADTTGAESSKARPANLRPDVDRSTPSVFANNEGKPDDDQDAEQLNRRLQSIVHASTAGGSPGAGRGGETGAGSPGSGGTRGAGSIASPLGAGGTGGPDPADGARILYLRAMQAKIQPLWVNAFPERAALDGLQGSTIISFAIDASGNVEDVVVSRPSGVPEFDENVRQAVIRGASYGDLPAVLRPGLRVNMTFTAKNPAVRPKDPGEGITN